MGKRSAYWGACLALVLTNILVWTYVALPQGGNLTVTFFDVGQGDSILIEGPSGRQMLIDGGKDRSALRQLSKSMGPLDRSIDIIVETHPDADHIGGLPSVLERYRVSAFISSGIPNDTSYAKALTASVAAEKGVREVTAQRGMRIHLGGGAYADILYPDRSVSGVESNTGSIVMRVVYGETSFLLGGDAPSSVEAWLVSLDRADGEAFDIRSDVLKAGHHGSRTSTEAAWLAWLKPHLVVISAGKNNSYGHPHTEVVEHIRTSGAEMLSTAEEGTITLSSDGIHLRSK